MRRGLLIAASVLLALGALGWWQQDRLIGEFRILGRRGALAWEMNGQWRSVESEDRRRRSWGPHDAFLLDGLAFDVLEPGLELATLRYRRDPNPAVHDLLVVRVDPEDWDFRVFGDEDFSRRGILEHAGAANVAVNASFFAEEGPVGLVLQDGGVRVPQGSARAAHFLVDPLYGPRVDNRKGASLEGVEHGVQGFPAIMSGGETFSYMRVGGRGFPVHELSRRTAVCVDWDGQVVFAVTDTPLNGLTLNELATVMGGLGCEDAMGLDGGSSTALYVRAGDRSATVDARDGVPVVVLVEPRI